MKNPTSAFKELAAAAAAAAAAAKSLQSCPTLCNPIDVSVKHNSVKHINSVKLIV